MPKPFKIEKCGVRLLKDANQRFESYVEIKPRHNIEDGAVVTISGKCNIGGTIKDCVWTSEPIRLSGDIIDGPKSNRKFLKLNLKLTSINAIKPDVVVSNPDAINVTITNNPGSVNPEPSDPEDADPIFFP